MTCSLFTPSSLQPARLTSKMSRLYDTIEPSVVNEEMLQKAIVEQGPQGPAGRIAAEEGIEYDEVTQLRLEFLSKDETCG